MRPRVRSLQGRSFRIGSFRDRDPIAVGLVSATLLALLVAGVYLVGTQGVLKDRYTVSGVFSDTGDLHSGDEVRVAGVRVGEVSAVTPDFKSGQVVVTWKVDSSVRLGAETRAEIRTANVLGGRYLRLTGAVTKPYLSSLPQARRRIPLTRTQTPTTVTDVLSSTTRAVGKLDTAALDKVLSQLTGINAATKGRLSRSFSNLAALAQSVSASGADIDKLLSGGDRLISIAHAKDGQLRQLLTNVRALLAELRARRDELAGFLGSGSDLVRSLTTLIDTHQTQLTGIMSDLRTSLTTLRPQMGNLDTVLSWAGPTLTGLSGIGGYGPWMEVVATGLGPLSPKDLAGLVNGK